MHIEVLGVISLKGSIKSTSVANTWRQDTRNIYGKIKVDIKLP